MFAARKPAPTIGTVSKVRGTFITIGGLLFGLTLGALVVAAIAVQFLDYKIVRVESGSMAPTLEVGDLVVVKPAGGANVGEGDVVLFRSNVGVPVMHRIIGVSEIVTNVRDQDGELVGRTTEYRFITQGDANPNPDANEVEGEQVEGEVWFTIPAIGGSDTFTLQFFLLLIAGIIALGWLSYEGYRLLGRREKKKRPAESEETYTEPES